MRALSNSGNQENLNQDLIRQLPFRYPNDPEEQSKVVGCLSALDAQIAAETQKLDALKTHKQGLMQQLFPSPGEQEVSGRALAPGVETSVSLEKPGASALPLTSQKPAASAVPLTGEVPSRKPYQVGFARQLLAAEILQHCHDHPTMGRVKLQKLIHLCEYHAELDDIHGSYARAAAGPFDNKLMRGVASGLEKQKWFKEIRDEKRTYYEPLSSRGQHSKYLQAWSEQLPKIREVIRLLQTEKTLFCEIASTLYAAWNDLLIDGQSPTDDEIIREASDPKRWHESKGKIKAANWPTALKWMRERGLVPRGYGAPTTKNSRGTLDS